ncbi:histidine kinase [Archangium violaceum]|uniref:ATP-binding protein n=1 Tax=Archangium violaceum TaxID=83451 RepID=UPI00193AE806|nr:ATP-binding protein [Archangium violaceum]QRK14105.1 histidine kinase [Archangium violaceum]
MNADRAALQAQLRVKKRAFFVSAGMMATSLLLHWLISPAQDPRLVLVQVAWSVSFVLLGLGVGAGLLAPWASGSASALVCIASVTAIVHYTGGPASPYFVTLVAAPLLLSMFTPDSRLPTLVSLGTMLGAVVLLNVLAGVPTGTFLPQVLTFGLIGSIGLYGGSTYRRLREAEKVAQEERLRALAQLAESERLRRRAERERAEVERLVLVGQLATGVAHEVNNPLAFVKSNLHYLEQELLGEGWPPDMSELRELLDETRQGVLRIQQIVTDLRRFSREGNGNEEEQGDPGDAMEEARRLASVRLRGLGDVELDVPSGLPMVRLGQRRLVQVLLNLLLNAADAVEGAEPARRARITLRARRTKEGVRLEVEDNGPGIPPEVLPRLFEPFFTTKPPGKGTGLGLALCLEYVARTGGTLTAENRPEGGARFVLTLTDASATASAA